MRLYRLLSIFFLHLLAWQTILGQDYLKTLDSPEKYLEQKIARIGLGEIVIGTSSLEALNTGDNGRIFLSKMDNCGQLIWSYSYETEGYYIAFKDIAIGGDDDIFVFGSAYQGFDERIFLMKVDKAGIVRRFKLYNTGTVDHFSYNIAIEGNQIMAYGLLLDWNVQKQGFVAVFDDEANYVWGKRFAPVITGGEAIFTPDGGFLCRTGKYLYKLNSIGDLQWASISTSDVPAPVAGPIAINGGYIFEAIQNNQAFFYKLSPNGDFLWSSPKFPSINYPAAVLREGENQILAVYGMPTGDTNGLAHLRISANGDILEQAQLMTEHSFTTGEISHTWSDDGYLTISANPAIPPAPAPALRTFLLQTSLEQSANECFTWEGFSETYPNDFAPDFIPLDTAIMDLNMTLYEGNFPIERSSTSSISFRNECELSPDQSQLTVDTLLECGETWMVDLPSTDFIWLDSGRSESRELSEEGTYKASNLSCTNPIAYTFTLAREACACEVYLPNAFSPNGDGQNDQLNLFSGCNISKAKTTVYGRWGSKLLENNTTDFVWDGSSNGQAVPPGLYLVVVNYELVDEVGETQQGEVVQEVMIIK